MAKRGRPSITDGETSREMRVRRASAFLVDPLRAFIPALNPIEEAELLPSRNARNTATPSDKKTRYQTFLLAVQKVRRTRRLSKLDTLAAVRNAVAELQYIRREILPDERKEHSFLHHSD
jgi:hypothetical protein